MVVFKKTSDLAGWLQNAPRPVAFVPTMGALHNGHRSLITAAKTRFATVVASIFVNPTQFNDKKDFDNYPLTPDSDIEMLTAAGANALLMPAEQEVYPDGRDAGGHQYSFGILEGILEGAHRPGHFRGVAQVVSRLLEMVQPDALFLGQKDFQQCVVLEQLLQKMNLAQTVQVVKCPTIREADGLAMSSRNRRLSEAQRSVAATFYQCLVSIQAKSRSNGSFPVVQKECLDLLTKRGFQPEYVALCQAATLQELPDFTAQVPMVALIAARLGHVRLIDNMLLGTDREPAAF